MTVMKFIVAAILTTIGLGAGSMALAADKPLVVVELFTSQGCNSCPPADALIEELAARDDVLPLALHVDYWDYIGWADNFANPQYTQRQKDYAHVAGVRSIYTPQMIVEGVDHVVGYRPMKVADLLQHYRDAGPEMTLSATQSGGVVHLTGAPVNGAKLPNQIDIQLVRYIPSARVNILHGENAGSTITYANIVQDWDKIGTWNGRGIFNLNAHATGEGAFAVIVQERGPGRILAALRVE